MGDGRSPRVTENEKQLQFVHDVGGQHECLELMKQKSRSNPGNRTSHHIGLRTTHSADLALRSPGGP